LTRPTIRTTLELSRDRDVRSRALHPERETFRAGSIGRCGRVRWHGCSRQQTRPPTGPHQRGSCEYQPGRPEPPRAVQRHALMGIESHDRWAAHFAIALRIHRHRERPVSPRANAAGGPFYSYNTFAFRDDSRARSATAHDSAFAREIATHHAYERLRMTSKKDIKNLLKGLPGRTAVAE